MQMNGQKKGAQYVVAKLRLLYDVTFNHLGPALSDKRQKAAKDLEKSAEYPAKFEDFNNH